MPAGGKIYSNGEEVGVVNSVGHSHRMGKAISLVHVKPGLHEPGIELEGKTEDGVSFTATVTAMPMYDPQKKAMRSQYCGQLITAKIPDASDSAHAMLAQAVLN